MFQNKKLFAVLIACLIAVVISVTPKTEAYAAGVQNYATGSYVNTISYQEVNMYVAADQYSTVVATLPANSVCTVEGIEDIWVKVNHLGTVGYIYYEYVEYNEEVINSSLEKAEAERLAREALLQQESIRELAALIHCEAGSEPIEGQIAVGAVVMNRVKSDRYPNDIHSVIYQPGQFTPAGRGSVANRLATGNIKQSCLDAALAAFQGMDNTGGLLHFHAGSSGGLQIGRQVFY